MENRTKSAYQMMDSLDVVVVVVVVVVVLGVVTSPFELLPSFALPSLSTVNEIQTSISPIIPVSQQSSGLLYLYAMDSVPIAI